ncbi:GntR family transcriptional regulator [Paucibacter sp. APW11]|uniref:GntR family transcriptional regulator n=1 Tax=Roseateles aquae TaxID=3077235 RepID=A0ABU3P8K0_9BURK|nr:GntR family transcriptional regulator [Paucibacter sp. APW11]MDT8998818.1 GntR family transcriptional regulator [Paucibacter sp. APW11]
MPQASLTRRALYEDVAEHLRQQIFGRQLEPGAWIDELQLCAELGISRTPLREALKVLAAEGLVTMKVRRGAYVTEMSEQDVREAYELLSLLESDAAARVAAQAEPAALARLQALHQELEAQIDQHDAFFRANEDFHMALLALEGNRWRQQIVNDLRRVMKLNRHHSLFKRGRLEESLQEHRELMQALMAGEAERTRSLMARHFANGLAATRGAPAQLSGGAKSA